MNKDRELLLLKRGEQIRQLAVQPSDAFEAGQMVERARVYKLLKNLKVIRDSMLGDNWKVIYTEQGAMDITLDRLEGTE